jgi:hypothetical protein
VQASFGVSSLTRPLEVGLIGAYKANDFRHYANGTAGTPNTSGTLPTPTTGRIGNALGVNYWNGYIKRISYWNQALPNWRLQELSRV